MEIGNQKNDKVQLTKESNEVNLSKSQGNQGNTYYGINGGPGMNGMGGPNMHGGPGMNGMGGPGMNYNPNMNWNTPNMNGYGQRMDVHVHNQQGGQTDALAIVSLVFSVLSLLFCCGYVGWIFGIVAIITGIIAYNSNKNTMAKTALITSIILFILSVVYPILAVFTLVPLAML